VIRSRERRLLDRVRELARWSARYAVSLVSRRPAPRGGDWTISTLARFEERHEEFVSDALSQFEFVAERSIAYLNWRYCDPRGGPFTVRAADWDGELLGFAVTRVLDGRAYLADILARPGRVDVAETLIRDAIRLAEVGGASFVRTRLPRRNVYSRALARAGFFDIGHFSGELVRERRVPASDLALLDDERTTVHWVMADSDYV